MHATSDAIATDEKDAFCCVKKLLAVQLYKQRGSQKRTNVFFSRKYAHTPLNNGRSEAARHTPAGVQGMTPAGVQGMRPSARLAALATRRQAGVEVSPGTTVPLSPAVFRAEQMEKKLAALRPTERHMPLATDR